MIPVRYTNEAGITSEHEVADDKLDELLVRADARFLPPWTAKDEENFQRILAHDAERRTPKRERR